MAQESITSATQTLTASGAISDAETVTIAGKVYTFQAALTDVDGNVHIGATDADTLSNLFAAINLSNDGESAVGAGTDYAASMTRNPEVVAVSVDATTLVVGAPGVAADRIPVAETGVNLAWGAGTLAGGAGNVGVLAEELLDQDDPKAAIRSFLLQLSPRTD